MWRALGLTLFIGWAFVPRTAAAPHPFHDDGGMVNWRPTLDAALQLAHKTGKPLFVEGVKAGDGTCRQFAKDVLQDGQVSLALKRHFVCVVVDMDKAPPEIKPLFDKPETKGLPSLLFLTDRLEYVQGHNGVRNAKDFRADLEKVLADKAFALPKKSEAELTKQTDALEKALGAKDYKKAVAIFQAIGQIKGHNAVKDRAYDLMDKAEEDGANVLRKAADLARKTDLVGAKEALKDFPTKLVAGLPIAAEAKDHAAALKLLETADQTMVAKKGNWKPQVAQMLDQILQKYPDTPYASFAMRMQRDLKDQ